ncbi:hypothetical protein NMY22_g10572 [Coprinellus aureogranulatus]|nr:hypothetical protein NMY22_g10572 [Coprinellus aureogranulatus]
MLSFLLASESPFNVVPKEASEEAYETPELCSEVWEQERHWTYQSHVGYAPSAWCDTSLTNPKSTTLSQPPTDRRSPNPFPIVPSTAIPQIKRLFSSAGHSRNVPTHITATRDRWKHQCLTSPHPEASSKTYARDEYEERMGVRHTYSRDGEALSGFPRGGDGCSEKVPVVREVRTGGRRRGVYKMGGGGWCLSSPLRHSLIFLTSSHISSLVLASPDYLLLFLSCFTPCCFRRPPPLVRSPFPCSPCFVPVPFRSLVKLLQASLVPPTRRATRRNLPSRRDPHHTPAAVSASQLDSKKTVQNSSARETNRSTAATVTSFIVGGSIDLLICPWVGTDLTLRTHTQMFGRLTLPLALEIEHYNISTLILVVVPGCRDLAFIGSEHLEQTRTRRILEGPTHASDEERGNAMTFGGMSDPRRVLPEAIVPLDARVHGRRRAISRSKVDKG